MASNPKPTEVIDLTEPEVIELNSEGELVPDARIPTETSREKQEQGRKKRKKRKRKSTGASTNVSEMEDGEVGASSAEASRPHSRNSPNVDDVELVISVEAPGSVDKKTLQERLTETAPKPRESRRERREKERERDREGEVGRTRHHDRERERARGHDREQRRYRDREHGRERERDGEHGSERSRRRSRSRDRDRDSRRKRKASPTGVPLFFEDVNPTEVPGLAKPQELVAGPSNLASPANASKNTENSLLLPAHVSVAEGDLDTSSLKVPTPEGSDDEDYIDYLDYDDDRRAGMIRYWELDKLAASESKLAKPTRTICKNCGAEGDHKTFECPVLICLTCGARDEHTTRSCPISKTCYTCGMKGHINRTCPNRSASRGGAYSHYQDCNRCGARTHQTNECPTLWRIYEYVADDERQEILHERESKRALPFGQGGEGYIATDEWCYNCGGSGHLGDDCTDSPKMFDVPQEPSAFSLYNMLSGPFFSEASQPSRRAPREWETAGVFADGHGSVVPMEVGKQGRKKERARLARRAQEIEEGNDEDDWFDNAHARGRSGGGGAGVGGQAKGSRWDRSENSSKGNANGKVRFDFTQATSADRNGRDGGEREQKRHRVSHDDPPGPSRETDSIQIKGASKKQDRYQVTGSRDRYARDQRSSRGPRYRGGYSR
ncbi:hypothetical protein BC628DRAFT_1309582 [Trametes gibbosa]|nr:hypothetical protein BC628DRAFT_1309582 [Trametes gibbosa]